VRSAFREGRLAWATPAIALTLFLGAAATAWGLSQMRWPDCIPFTTPGMNRLLLLLGGGTVSVWLATRFLRVSPLVAGLIVASSGALLANSMLPLFTVVWIAATCLLIGDAFVVPENEDISIGMWAVRWLVGAAILGTLIGLLAHLNINGPPLYAALLIGPILSRKKRLMQLCDEAVQAYTQGTVDAPSTYWLKLTVVVLSLLHITVALMPEVAHDGLVMHLFIPAHLAQRGTWGFDASLYAWAVMPMLGDWLFSLGYMFAGEQGARLVNVLCILTLASLVYDLVLWGGGTARGGAWGAILFLSTPLTFTEASSLFVEPAWACFVVAGTLLLLRAGVTPMLAASVLPVVGILFGAALAAKAWSLVILPAIAVVAVAAYPSLLHPRNATAITASLARCITIGGVPYLTAWWLTANPVFPFYNKVFQSPLFPSENFQDQRWHASLSWSTLYELTFNSGRYLEARNGAAGFEWLPLLPPTAILVALTNNKRPIVLLGMGCAIFVAVFSSTSYLRYVFPAGLFLLAAIGIGISLFHPRLNAAVAALLAAITMLNCLFLNAGPNFYDDFPLQAVFSRQSRDAYLAHRAPLRLAVEVVNTLNTSRSPVAVFGPPMVGGLASDAILSSWYNIRFMNRIAKADSADIISREIAACDVEYIILDGSWDTPQKRAYIESVSTPIYASGGISVRRMRDACLYGHELLSTPIFAPDMTGWSIPECVRRTQQHELLVTAACHAYQVVNVKPGARYRNSVTGRCPRGTALARTQLSWLDGTGAVIHVDGEAFECGATATEHVMTVTAPANAASVVVYTCGHTDSEVAISANSLRHRSPFDTRDNE
jgi:hypothetical protein